MRKKTIDDIQVTNKRVLIRVDYNVPLENGKVANDLRIRKSLPTIKKLLSDSNALVLMSHLGRPGGKVDPKLSLAPVAKHLSKLLGQEVKFVNDCVGDDVNKAVDSLKPGEVMLLENVRFHPGEKKNSDEFAKKLARHGEVFVNDAFSVCHRAHASVVGVPKFLRPAVAGYLLQSEIKHLGIFLDDPARPFVAVIGGAKVSTKIGVFKNLLPRVDKILVGGGMSFTFFSAWGLEVGKSLVEENSFQTATEIFNLSEELGGRMLLPVDILVAKELDPNSPVKTVPYDHIPKNWIGVDIGQATIQLYTDEILKAKSVFMNGPMGIFEIKPFSEGTRAVLEAMAEVASKGNVAVVGGGDSAAAAYELGFADMMTHISTGGGASLEFMEGKELPGISVLDDAE